MYAYREGGRVERLEGKYNLDVLSESLVRFMSQVGPIVGGLFSS